jgi:hypothetical protein
LLAAELHMGRLHESVRGAGLKPVPTATPRSGSGTFDHQSFAYSSSERKHQLLAVGHDVVGSLRIEEAK